MRGTLVLAASVLVGGIIFSTAVDLKGVKRSEEIYYKGISHEFVCKDGSKQIHSSQINDDYCDCPDGSDEPGTAACSGIMMGSVSPLFACKPEGFPEDLIQASRVGDGICDCCDGSDEDIGACGNHCQEKHAAALERRREQLASFQAGAAERRRMAAAGREARARRAEWLAGAAEERARLRAELEVAKAARAEAGAREMVAARGQLAKRLNFAWELMGINDMEDKDVLAVLVKFVEKIDAHQEFFLATVIGEDHDPQTLPKKEKLEKLKMRKDLLEEKGYGKRLSAIPKEELLSHAVKAISLQESTDLHTALLMFLKRKSEYLQIFYSILQQALGRDVPACLDEEADRERQEEDALEEVCLDEEADRQTQGEDSLEKKEQEEEDVTCAAEDLEKLDTLAKVVRGLDFSFSSPEGQAAREAVAAAERALEEADERAEELEEEEELHFGEEQQFWELSQACFDKRVGAGRDVATFTVCPFKEVKQVVGGTFKLGHFEALEPTEHELGLWVMRFEGGEKCWNGPKRSAKVYLGCGAATELVSADEPSRCEYRLLLRTPAACDARFAAAAGLSPPPAS